MLSSAFSFTACNGYFYYPQKELFYPPKQYGFSPEQFELKSKDGTKLVGWWFKPTLPKGEKPKGTIVQFHGNGENMSSFYLSLAWLTKYGYNLYTFDYRGYGGSDGEPSREGVYEDSLVALDDAWKKHSKSGGGKFIVYGQSLGGNIAASALIGYERKTVVDLLVMDSTFLRYKDIARTTLAGFWLTWPLSPLGLVLVDEDHSASKGFEALSIPVLVIHDKRDPVVPYGFGEELYSKAKCPKHFWQLDYKKHVGVFSREQPEHRVEFVKFLDSPSGRFQAECSQRNLR